MGLRNRTRLIDYHCFFITTTCNNFLPLLDPEPIKEIITENIIHYNKQYNCRTISYVVMPEHIHLMLYFEGENKLIPYMRDFKKFTSFKIRRYYSEHDQSILSQLHYVQRTQKFKVWMHRFDNLFLYSRKVILTKLNYIHNNPVKRGLCESPEDYLYSSAAFYSRNDKPAIPILHVEDIL
jgi:putative transposase